MAKALKVDRTQAFIAVGTLAGLADDTLTGIEMQRMARWCLRRQGAGNVRPDADDKEIQRGIEVATQAIEAGQGSDLLSAALKALPTQQDRLEALRGVLYVVATESSRGLEGTLVPLLGALMGIARTDLHGVWSVLPMTRIEAIAALATMVASVDDAISKGELEVVMSWTASIVADWARDPEAEHAGRVEVRSGYERALHAVGKGGQQALLDEVAEALPRPEDRVHALGAAVQVVMEDRDFTAAEKKFLIDLAGRLGLERDEAQRILSAHHQRVA